MDLLSHSNSVLTGIDNGIDEVKTTTTANQLDGENTNARFKNIDTMNTAVAPVLFEIRDQLKRAELQGKKTQQSMEAAEKEKI